MDLTPPTPNIPLLRKAVEWAEAEAAKTDGTCMWNQFLYAGFTECGTSHCIAGYAVTASLPNAQVDEWGDLRVNGQNIPWRSAGMDVLGITPGESYRLFDGLNTIADVRRIAEDIAARVGERL